MESHPELLQALKRLKLSGILHTLPDRLAMARAESWDYPEFLEVILSDEISRRDQTNLTRRLTAAGFEEECTLERFDWTAEIQFDRRLVRELFSLAFMARHEHVIFYGPVGVGKSFLASALGHAACRQGHSVLFTRAETMLKTLAQARADHSWEREFRRYLTVDLLLLDDFALRRMNAQQSSDFYELVVERHAKASMVLTSNRSVDEWVAVFDDPILANSALDRLAHRAYQLVIEGQTYRKRMSPHHRQLTEEVAAMS